MTPEQKRQVIGDLVRFVSTVTHSQHDITKAEAMALPAVLDFLMKTDSQERLYRIASEDEIISSTASPDLHKMIKKFVESKE
jgi:hypothetical protein